jgi:hypothetical protein
MSTPPQLAAQPGFTARLRAVSVVAAAAADSRARSKKVVDINCCTHDQLMPDEPSHSETIDLVNIVSANDMRFVSRPSFISVVVLSLESDQKT